jgi:hypothetical protein
MANLAVMQKQIETDTYEWRRLIADLPHSKEQLGVEISRVLALKGYLHIQDSMSLEDYELVARELGTIILRSDVKVDLERERSQEQVRKVKGRGGIYSPTPLGLHTDPHAELVSWYCIEQDDIGGPMLMIQVNDLKSQFSAHELEVLTKVELLSPGRDGSTGAETLTPTPLLTSQNGKHRIFYASWLLQDSYGDEATQVLEKFAAYLKRKEESQLISLPIKKQDTIFIDNGRMLHGRGALAAESKRHLVRFYLRAAGN